MIHFNHEKHISGNPLMALSSSSIFHRIIGRFSLKLLLLPFLLIPFFGAPQSAHASLTTNIWAYYEMQGNSNDQLSNAGGSDTNMSYSTPAGKIGEGAIFNGSSSYISFTTSSVGASGQFSYCAWAKASASGETGAIIGHRDNGSLNWRMIYVSSGTISGYTRAGGSVDETDATSNMNDLAYHFICFTSDGTTQTIYFDGSSQGSGATTNPGNVIPFIGVEANDNGTPNTDYWTGDIDEVGEWTRALTSAEVTTLYNQGCGLQYNFSPIPPCGNTTTTSSSGWWYEFFNQFI